MRQVGFDPRFPIGGVLDRNGRVIISNGHHRVLAAIAAGIKSIPVDLQATTGENDG